ncbi:MAG: hypothetical protein M0R06_21950 [Sphaerochaeta sp.]|jgi:hypothetical protein|nr:hypothetical protein [Sphaerochaeta sp.]
MITCNVNLSGPIFDGSHQTAVDNFILDARWEVGTQGLANVQQNLDQSIKYPTPYYETQVIIQRFAQADIVHDRDIIYGRWLEGTSERNRTTRFKGYASFRRATQELEGQVDSLVEHVLTRHIGRM